MQNITATYGRLIEETNCDYLRYMHNQIAWKERLIGIKGARGVGKTTLLLQHIKLSFPNLTKALYVSLDNIWFSTHTLTELADYMYTHGVESLFLDEVHRYPNWVREIKNIYDSYPTLHIVFTGSSLLEIEHAEADLSRRVSMYHMYGQSLREYSVHMGLEKMPVVAFEDVLNNHFAVSSGIVSKHKVLPLFEQYLESGYYPFIQETADIVSYRNRIGRMINMAIDEDILAVEDLSYETLLKTKRLLSTLAQTVPFTPSITTLCETLSTTRNQVLKLMTLLERADLLIFLRSDSHRLKSVGKPDKILFNDTNIMHALANNVDKGTERESFVASSLKAAGHDIQYPKKGDMLVDGKYLLEIGGRNKTFEQIAEIPNSYVVADEIEVGFGNKIPLWLFGLLY